MDQLEAVSLQNVDPGKAPPVAHFELVGRGEGGDGEGAVALWTAGERDALPVVVAEVLMAHQHHVRLQTQLGIARGIVAVIGIDDDGVAPVPDGKAGMPQPLDGHMFPPCSRKNVL